MCISIPPALSYAYTSYLCFNLDMNFKLLSFLFYCLLLCSSQLCANPDLHLTINRGNGAEPDSLDIHQAQGLNSQNILMDMYEGLMTFDAMGKPVYGVAVGHQVNDDYTRWSFKLNPQARWSDGTEVTANDFIQSWKTAVSPATAAPYRQLFENLISNQQLQLSSQNKHQLSITLNQADVGLLSKLVLPVFYPKPQHTDQINVSNGAFFLQQWDIQERITLQKNPYFHAANKVQVMQINYWVTENQNSELLRFRAGELDITETIPDSQIKWLREHLPRELRIAPYYGTFFLGLNLNHKHLSNQYLRQALSAAIDRNILVEKVLKSGQLPATNIIPPPKNGTTGYAGIDLSEAKRLLKLSQFNSQTERLEILYNNSDNQKMVALAVAAMWRQNLGIKSKLKNQEWKVFVNSRRGNNKQVFRSGWIADYHDPLNFLELFHSQSHFNFYGFNHSGYDQVVEQLRTSHQVDADLIQQAEDILAEQLPVIPLYHYVSRHLVKTHIKGFDDNPMDRHLSRYLSHF